MGAVVAAMIFKNGKEKVATSYTSLWDIPAIDIDGNKIERLGKLVVDKKAILVVNVATNWGLTDKNYKGMVKIHE